MSEQRFAEASVLVAVMDGDLVEARALLADFFPNELVTFERQAQELVEMIGAEARRQRVAS